MSTITLEQIKADADALAAKIAIFESQTTKTTTFVLPETAIKLRPGEHYAGLIVGHNGTPSHHVILLPGDNDDDSWKAQQEWAASIGGDLPTRIEQAMLFAYFRDHFKKDWYWSNEEHQSVSGYAWFQDFDGGGQSNSLKGDELRARAIRRLVIE